MARCFSIGGGLLTVAMLAGCPAGTARAQPANQADSAFAAALKLQESESYAPAADAWEKFLKAFPADARADRAYHYLGVAQFRLSRLDQAQAALRTAIDKYPKSDVLEATYFYLGVTQCGLGRAGRQEALPAALATLQTLIDKYPKGSYLPDAKFYRADCLSLQGKKKEAGEAYARLLEEYPKHRLAPYALYALGVSQEEQGRPYDAAKTYAAFMSRFPEDRLADEVLMRRGIALMAAGSAREAIPLLAAAAGKAGFASADYALLCQAEAMTGMKQYAEAAAAFLSLPGKFPQSPYADRARVLAGKCHYLAGQYGEVHKLLDPLAASGGASAAEAAHWLALSLVKEGQPDQAVALADRVTARVGQVAGAAQLATDAADALFDSAARRREAIARYAAVAAKFPSDPIAPQALYMAGVASSEQGDFAAALGHAQAFLAAYPDQALSPDVLRLAAESSLQLGKHAEADKLYAQLIERYPKHGDVELWKVRRLVALQMQKKYEAMIPAAERLLAELHTPDALAETQYLVGSAQFELKQYAAAAKSLAAAVAPTSRWRRADDAWLLLAAAYRESNDLPNARAALAKLIAACPDSRLLDRAYDRLGAYAYAAGDYRAAADAYRQLSQRWPESPLAPQALHELGCVQLQLKDAAAAEQTLSTLLEKHPQHALTARARYARALARHQQGKFGPAIEDAQAVLALTPAAGEKSDARYLLGLCQVALKQHAAAAATFQTLLAEDPKYADADNARFQAAWANSLAGNEAEAAKQFAKLAADSPQSPLAAESQFRAGQFAYQNKDYAAAADAFYAITEKAADTPWGEPAARGLGLAFFQQGDYDRALAAFRYQEERYPRGPLAQDAAFLAGECLLKQGKHADALSAYARVEKPPTTQYRLLALLHGAQAAGQAKQWQRGAELLERAAKQFPDSPLLPEILYEQGWVEQNLGHTDQALALYRNVIAKSEREPAARAQLRIGQIQAERGDRDRAAESFLKVLYGYSFPQWQAEAAWEAACVYEAMGKKDEAIRLSRELIARFPASDKAAEAKKRLDAPKK